VALTVETEAASWRLIVSEALTNALKHAVPEGRKGRVRVGLDRTGGAAERRG
jgi:two-component sensor histidine kinase